MLRKCLKSLVKFLRAGEAGVARVKRRARRTDDGALAGRWQDQEQEQKRRRRGCALGRGEHTAIHSCPPRRNEQASTSALLKGRKRIMLANGEC